MVPASSVTAVTNPASSAMLCSSPARADTGRYSGEDVQRSCTSPPSVTGALSRPGSTLPSERAQDSVTSWRSVAVPPGRAPGTLSRGTQRDHSCSSTALRCLRSGRCDMASPCRRTGFSA